MADDFIDVVNSLTNFVQNDRISSYNEGLDDAIDGICGWMLLEGIWQENRAVGPNEGITELLNQIKEHFEAK